MQPGRNGGNNVDVVQPPPFTGDITRECPCASSNFSSAWPRSLSPPLPRAEPQWLTLPPTPSLPQPEESGLASVNGIKIWYATFGRGEPVILWHGGLANSNY